MTLVTSTPMPALSRKLRKHLFPRRPPKLQQKEQNDIRIAWPVPLDDVSLSHYQRLDDHLLCGKCKLCLARSLRILTAVPCRNMARIIQPLEIVSPHWHWPSVLAYSPSAHERLLTLVRAWQFKLVSLLQMFTPLHLSLTPTLSHRASDTW